MRVIRTIGDEDRELFLHCEQCRAVWGIDWPDDREEYFTVSGREPARLFATRCPACEHDFAYTEPQWNRILAEGGTPEGVRVEAEGEEDKDEPEGDVQEPSEPEGTEPEAAGSPPASE